MASKKPAQPAKRKPDTESVLREPGPEERRGSKPGAASAQPGIDDSELGRLLERYRRMRRDR